MFRNWVMLVEMESQLKLRCTSTIRILLQTSSTCNQLWGLTALSRPAEEISFWSILAHLHRITLGSILVIIVQRMYQRSQKISLNQVLVQRKQVAKWNALLGACYWSILLQKILSIQVICFLKQLLVCLYHWLSRLQSMQRRTLLKEHWGENLPIYRMDTDPIFCKFCLQPRKLAVSNFLKNNGICGFFSQIYGSTC